MQTDLTNEEVELINHFRGCSEFNRGRILVLARTAHEDYRWAQKVRQNQQGIREESAEAPRGG